MKRIVGRLITSQSACHYWARLLRSFCHEVKLIAPQLVKPAVHINNEMKIAPRKIPLPRGLQIRFKNLSGFERLERVRWGNWVSLI